MRANPTVNEPTATQQYSERFTVLAFGLPGLIGTLLVTIGAFGVGWLALDSVVNDFGFVEVLRTTDAGSLLARILVVTGVAILLQTWLLLGHDLLSGWPMRVRTQATILGIWIAPLLIAPPIFSRDMYSYFAQGRLMSEGYDPYTTGVSALPGWFVEGVDPLWGESPAPYGPLWLLLAQGVAEVLGTQSYLAALVFRLVAVVGLVLLLVNVPKLAAEHGLNPHRAVWLAVLNPLVVIHFVAAGHNDALMVGMIVWAFQLGYRHHPLVGAAMIGLAAAIKPIALLALPFLGLMVTPVGWTWWRRVRDWALVSVIALAAFGVTALFVGAGLGWLSALTTPGTVKTWLSPMTALGMIVGGTLERLGLAENNETAVAVFRAIGTVISLAAVAYLALRPQGRSPVRAAGLAFLIVVVLGPVVHPWYLLWILPLLVSSGLTSNEVRAAILLTLGFGVHAMVEGSSTVDSFFDLSAGLAIAASIALVALILLASRRERQMVLERQVDVALRPLTEPDQERYRSMLIGPPVAR